jgi:predicted outer membrane repeat protein
MDLEQYYNDYLQGGASKTSTLTVMNTLVASQESLSGMISLDSDQIQLHQKPQSTATAKKVPVRDESTPTFNNSSNSQGGGAISSTSNMSYRVL